MPGVATVTDTPADHTNEKVLALTPTQLGIVLAVLVALVLFRRTRKRKDAA